MHEKYKHAAMLNGRLPAIERQLEALSADK